MSLCYRKKISPAEALVKNDIFKVIFGYLLLRLVKFCSIVVKFEKCSYSSFLFYMIK